MERQKVRKKKGLGIYKHLMNGVSNMLFVVGGDFNSASVFVWWYKGGIPLAELFMSIGGGKTGAFYSLYQFSWIYCKFYCDRPGFMPGVVGGFLAANANAGF